MQRNIHIHMRWCYWNV